MIVTVRPVVYPDLVRIVLFSPSLDNKDSECLLLLYGTPPVRDPTGVSSSDGGLQGQKHFKSLRRSVNFLCILKKRSSAHRIGYHTLLYLK